MNCTKCVLAHSTNIIFVSLAFILLIYIYNLYEIGTHPINIYIYTLYKYVYCVYTIAYYFRFHLTNPINNFFYLNKCRFFFKILPVIYYYWIERVFSWNWFHQKKKYQNVNKTKSWFHEINDFPSNYNTLNSCLLGVLLVCKQAD